MNDYFMKNIEAMPEKDKQIKSALLDLHKGVRKRDDLSAQLCDAGGRGVLTACRAEGKVYQLGSMYSDETVTELWNEIVDLSKVGYMSKMIFFGMGNGCILRKIFALQNDTLKIVVYEPSLTLFHDILTCCDLSDVLSDPRLILNAENMPYAADEYLYKYVEYTDLERLHYQPYPNYRKLFPKEQKEFLDATQVLYNAIQASQNVMVRYGQAYYENALNNIRHFVFTKSLLNLYVRMPKEIPCILVASGPSLDKNIDCLKNLQGKAFMIAADSAVRVLLRHDIIPDMFVSIDAKKMQKHFEDPRIANIPILTEIACNYRTLNKVHAPMFFYNDLNAHVNDFLTRNNILLPCFTSGGSVIHSAYALTVTMGFHTVILVGQDLAYTDNKTHSQESVRGERHMNTDEMEGYMTEGYYGGKVKTSYEFQLYKEWFEEQIALYQKTRTINATEGGALIKGAENMPLCEAVERFCTKEYDVRGLLWDCGELFDEQTKREFIAYMCKAPEELRRIAEEVKGAIRDYDKILQLAYDYKLGTGEMKRLLRKTGEVSKLVEEAPVMYYVQNKMQAKTQEFLDQVYAAKDDVRSEVIDMAKLGKENLQAILDTIRICLPEIENWKNTIAQVVK